MADASRGKVGRQNEKVDDTDIQGVKAGQRNRAATETGDTPPPAGEPRPDGPDPRKPKANQAGSRS
jgi:hypothetical protein